MRCGRIAGLIGKGGSLVRPEGLEPPAYWFEASRSIRLSYGRTGIILTDSPGYVASEFKPEFEPRNRN